MTPSLNVLKEDDLQLLKELGSCMSDCLFIMKVEGSQLIYEFMNDSGYELARLNRKDLGKSLYECLPESEAAFLTNQYEEVLELHHKISYKDTVVFPDVQYLAETTLFPLKNAQSHITYILAVTKNISMYSMKSPEMRHLNRIFSSYTENTEEAFALFDVDLNFLRINESFYRIFGYQKSELYAQSWFVIYPNTQEDFLKLIKKLKTGMKLKRFEYQMQRKNGEWMTASIGLTAITDENGDYTRIVMILEDISEKVNTKKQLVESENRYRLIADHSQDLIKIIDREGIVQYASPSHSHVLGYEPSDLVGNKYIEHIYSEDHKVIKENSLSLLTDLQELRYEVRMIKNNGEVLWVETRLTPVKNEEGGYTKIVSTTRDITKRKRAEDKLRQLAYTDHLTGLTNRRVFEDYLSDIHAGRTEVQVNKFALIYLDGDQFKSVNDEFGHNIGDELLRYIGERLERAVRKEDIVSRVGGDEFAILLPNVSSSKEAESVARRIIESIRQLFYIQDHTFNFTCSLGISIYPDDSNEIEDIQKFADLALYEAKKRGRSQHIFYSSLQSENQHS
ncbi:bifunctional diguanylate cyclase/phosphodiesterase [Halobacillus campisalis]|uniref:Diguanylate cyclase domain-containing protein n=1 Tax=Halobacillus campisalis TaxID=435909 RepID=A0ABW2K3P8_9BACI|nr:diguanylate cyclase [Halobacillus campisalis]